MIGFQKHTLVIYLQASLVAVLLCAHAFAANSPDSALIHDIKSAAKLLDENKLDLALRKCNSVLQQDRSNVSALALRSLTYSSKHDEDKASADERKALTLPCKTAYDELMVSKLLLRRHQFENALAHLTKGIEIDANDPRLYCQRSYLDREAHDNKKAMDDLNKALEIDPHCAEAYSARSQLRRGMHNYAAALSDIDQAIKIAPTADNYLDRALADTRMNRYSDAVIDYGKAISLAPRSWAYSGRAASYLNLGQTDKAWSDLDKAIAMDPYFMSPRKLKAQAFLACKQPAKALAELDKVERMNIHLQPHDNLEFEEVRYNAHEQMGDWGAAVDDLQNILREFPSERWAIVRLQPAKAMAISTKTKQPKMPSVNSSLSENVTKVRDAESHLKLSQAARKLSNFSTAIEEATRAITLDPRNCGAYIERGWAYYQYNQFEKAKADFENAALLDSKRPEPFEGLARLYTFQKDYQLALQNFSKAIPLSKYEEDYVARSETYLLIGKPKESLQDAELALKRNPRAVEAMVARANANIALNQPAKALSDLNFAIQLHPDKEEYLLLRAKAYEKLGQRNLAAKDRKTAEEQKKEIFDNAPFRTGKGE